MHINNTNSNVNFNIIENSSYGTFSGIAITNENSQSQINSLRNLYGAITLSGAVYTLKNIINADSSGMIQIDEACIDMKDFDSTGQLSRLSLSGDAGGDEIGGINSIYINKISLLILNDKQSLNALKNYTNISQFVSGAYTSGGLVDRNIYNNLDESFTGELIDTLKTHIQHENFLNIYGITGVGMSTQNSVGDFRTFATEVEDSESFYSLYMGYENMKMRSSNYSVGSRGLYAGFRYLDYITQLGEKLHFSYNTTALYQNQKII